MNFMKIVGRSFTVAALLVFSSLALAQSALDGRRFDTQAGFTGKPGHIPKDILSFEGGLFHSSDCDQYGYGKGRYQAVQQSDGTAFEVETLSAEYGRNVWKGIVKGDAIEGTMVFYRKPSWWRSNPEPLEHWFRGKAIQ